MRVSDAGLALVREFEGLRLDAYQDSVGVWTIGYGSTRYENGEPVKAGDKLASKDDADRLFRATLREYEDAVSRSVLVPLTQNQFDALVSLTYNIGVGAFQNSTLLRRLNAHDYRGASSEFLRWNKAGDRVLHGLVRRRERERELFLKENAPNLSADTRPNDALSGFDRHYPDLSSGDKPPVAAPATTDAPKATTMTPLLGPLIGLLTSVAPDLIRIFSDKDKPVSERNTEAAIKVLDIAKQVAEAPTPAAAVEQIVADPAKAQAFREAVQASWYELAPGDGGGVTGARQAAQAAREVPGWAGAVAAVNQFAMDVAVVGGGGWIMWSLATAAGTPAEVKTLIIGSIAGYIAAVVQFRYGSSVSSRAKDTALVDAIKR